MQFPDTAATRLTNQVMMKYRELNPSVLTSEFNATYTRLWNVISEVPEEGGELLMENIPEEVRETFQQIVQENHDKQLMDSIRRQPRRVQKVRRVLVNGKPQLVMVPKGPRHTKPKKRRK